MGAIRNIFALIGLLAVAAGAWLYTEYEKLDPGYVGFAQEMYAKRAVWSEFDPEAVGVYMDLARNILQTGNAAEATIWKVPVKEGLTPDEVEETMKFVANELNISNVGELPLSKDVEAKSGEPYRFVKIYMFCNSLTAKQMIDYSDAYSAYLPCRITMVEDNDGKLWLYALNMDLMIYGGKPLPPALKEEAVRVKEVILEIMERGAAGEF